MRSRTEEERLTRDVLDMPSDRAFRRSARCLKIFLIGGGLAALWRIEVLLLLSPLFAGIAIGLIARRRPHAAVVVSWVGLAFTLGCCHSADVFVGVLAFGIVVVPMACAGAASSSNVVRWVRGRFAEGELS